MENSQAGEWHQVEVLAGGTPKISFNTSSLVMHQESLYIFDRRSYVRSGTSLYRFRIPTKKWTRVHCKGTIPLSMIGHSAVIRRDAMYQFGGWCESRNPLNDFSRFSFVTKYWKIIEPWDQEWVPNQDPPEARAGHIMATNDDFLFVFGGCFNTCLWNGKKFAFPTPYVNDMYEYNYNSCMWTVTEQKGERPSPRICAGSCTHEGSLYVYGGCAGNHSLGDFHKFTMDSRTWTKISPLGQCPPPLFGLSCVSHANSVYIFGGRSQDGQKKDLYEYKLGSSTWTEITANKPPPALDRSFMGMKIYKDSMYIFGWKALYEFRFKIRRTSNSTYEGDMRSLVCGPKHADLKLLVGEEEIHVNKAILCARINYFRGLLENKAGMKESRASKHEAIRITDATAPTFRLFLDFVALNTVPADIGFEAALDLLALGDKYGVDHLVDLCEEIIETYLSVDNVVECLISAHNTGRGADGVKEMCKQIIGHNMKKVLDAVPDLLCQLKEKPDLLFEVSEIIVRVGCFN